MTGGLSLPQSTDEFCDLSFRIAELARDPKQLREQRGGAGECVGGGCQLGRS